MSNEYWDQDTNKKDVSVDLESVDINTFVSVNGMNVEVNPGDDFKESVIKIARDADYGKFRVFMNGEEIEPDIAPELFEDGMKVEIRPYDKAA